MFTLFKDALAAAALKAKGDRLARERAVALLEGAGRPSAYSLNDAAPSADAGWAEVGTARPSRSAPGRLSAAETRVAARELAAENPYAKNALRVLEAYVVGPGATLSHARRPTSAGVNRGDNDSLPGDKELRALWRRFWEANGPHVTLGELAVRVWRDGEAFVRFFPRHGLNGGAGDVPAARFLDPEEIGPTRERPDGLGVLTDPADAVTPVAYLRIDPTSAEHVETIPASEVLHVKAGADDAEVRGVSVLAPLIAPLTRHAEWLETELTARRVQASVVLWRKVQGNVSAYGDTDGAAGDLAGARADRGVFAPGSILTTPDTTNLEFLAPKSSFAEASQIGRALLLGAAAGVGLPEFMLTADASNANYASTMAAEGPAVKRFAAEQRFFAAALARLWALLAADAVARGVLSEAAVAGLAPEFTFAELAHRDRPAERGADVQLVRAGVLSRAELARREGVDPQRMRRELQAEVGE
ncbi:phage portal protein [Alienimonas californiensis]|uniref:Phage portal protein, lambda family n=1 Tax=Alienimonas californiensis TaxID=2527989 RepID=A0A517P6V0_9PLAN|nr:phage portal protein [Alienimonas californiensis]QDT15108.1 Phage portal protein, lambda family [Alienimonas californiensis]